MKSGKEKRSGLINPKLPKSVKMGPKRAGNRVYFDDNPSGYNPIFVTAIIPFEEPVIFIFIVVAHFL
jgi:hypothetical protein